MLHVTRGVMHVVSSEGSTVCVTCDTCVVMHVVFSEGPTVCVTYDAMYVVLWEVYLCLILEMH